MSPSQGGISESLLSLHGTSLDFDFRRAALWSWLERHLPSGSRVLDAGCGTGFMLRELGRRGYATVALECEPKLAASARELVLSGGWGIPVHGLALGTGQVQSLGGFDRILCLDVLEHIPDDRGALAELRDLLEPGGRVILSLPAGPRLYGRRDAQLGHYRRYSRRMLADLIRGAGLDLVDLRSWNLVGVLPYVLSERLLRRPLDDSLRRSRGGWLNCALRRALRELLRFEGRMLPPFGLSLLAVASRPRA